MQSTPSPWMGLLDSGLVSVGWFGLVDERGKPTVEPRPEMATPGATWVLQTSRSWPGGVLIVTNLIVVGFGSNPTNLCGLQARLEMDRKWRRSKRFSRHFSYSEKIFLGVVTILPWLYGEKRNYKNRGSVPFLVFALEGHSSSGIE